VWVVYILLGLAVVVLIVLQVPVYGRIVYDGTLDARLQLLGESVSLLPGSGKETSFIKRQIKKTTIVKRLSKTEELLELLREDSLAGTLQFLQDVAVLLGRAVGRLLRFVTVTDLRLQMLVATGDPADTAQQYGQVCSVLYPCLALIGQKMRIRRRHVRVEPNFLLDSGAARFDIRFRISLGRLVYVVVALLWGSIMIDAKEQLQDNKEVTGYEK